MMNPHMFVFTDEENINDAAFFNNAVITSVFPYLMEIIKYAFAILVSSFVIYKTKLWNIYFLQPKTYQTAYLMSCFFVLCYITYIVHDICHMLEKKFDTLNEEKQNLLKKNQELQEENKELKAILQKIANIYELELKKYK